MRLTFERTIRIPNPIAHALLRLRLWRYCQYWNSRLDALRAQAAYDASISPNAHFKWSHLVQQEIVMWIRLGDKVSLEEFTDMCRRRGFNERMSQTLEEVLRYCWLAGWPETRKDGPVMWNPYNKVVCDHHDGTIDLPATNAERKRRGLRVPWDPSFGDEEVHWVPLR